MPASRRYCFGEYTLDLPRGALLHGDHAVRLRPKSFAVLQLLVERHGELVTKEELLDRVWGRTVVSDGAITQCLIDVRRAIGDSTQQLIRTVPRRGYVFTAPVTPVGEDLGGAGSGIVPIGSPVAPPPTTPAVAPVPRRTFAPGLVAAAMLAVVLAAVLAWWSAVGRNRPATPPVPASETPTRAGNAIAVLPFVNLTGDLEGEYFSDGITEEILHLLVQADGLRVIARTSSFAFKGQAAGVHDIAAKLGVNYVVEGSVRRSGRNVRVTAQLIDAASDMHVWSNAYERDVRDLLEVQQDIAQHVATALQASLSRAAHPAYTVDPRAHDAFLRARYFFNRRLPGDLEKARLAYEEALRTDPRFARAWAGLAGVHRAEIGTPGTDAAVLLRKRKHAVEAALALDPGLAEARIRAASYYFESGDEVLAAEQAAIANNLAPNDPTVLAWHATAAAWQGRPDESIEIQRRIVASDPVSLVPRVNLANALLSAGRLAEARVEFEHYLDMASSSAGRAEVDVDLARLLLLEGGNEQALAAAQGWLPSPDRDFVLAAASDALQRPDDARAAEARLRKGAGVAEALRLAELYAWRGERDQAFAWIEEVPQRLGPNPWFSQDWQWMYELRFSPFLRALHGDPRWPAAARRAAPRAYDPTAITRADAQPPT